MNSRLFSLAGTLVIAASSVLAADWPQWRGPDRTGVSREKGLLAQWPKDGPKLLWKADTIGNGYSTPAVVGERVYLLSNRGDDEFALALNVKDGKEIWSSRLGKVGKNRGPQYPGARSTPTVEGEVLYALGSDGDLACLDSARGHVKWRKNLKSDFGGVPGNWAYSESPLIDGDLLVCTPGGKEATLVALNKKNGEVFWKCPVPGGDEAAYASAIVAQVGKVKMYVQFVSKGLVGVDARTGKFLWRYDKTIDKAANIPTPIFQDGYVFSSTGRNQGSLARLTADGDGVSVEGVWFNKSLTNGLGGMVLVNGHLYGTNTRDLLCVEFLTGKVKWQKPSVGQGSICYAEGQLYVRGDRGAVALVEATPTAYKEKGRFDQPKRSSKPAWPYPVVANGQLFLRDQGILLCYDIKNSTTDK